MAWYHFRSEDAPGSLSSLRVLESVGSTMDEARRDVLRGRVAFDRAGQTRYVGVMAREQTAGRGQRGRTWFAPYNESLSVTFFLRQGLADPAHAARLALFVGVAVADALRALLSAAPAPLPDIGLKWPNDILLNGRKLGGVLIEMVKAPDGGWVALVGIGLNLAVRAFSPELVSHATSLLLEGFLSVATLPPEIFASQIARSFSPLAAQACRQGFDALLQIWRAYDRTPGRRYDLEQDGLRCEGVAVGVEETGALLLRLADGTVRAVSSASSLREPSRNA